MANNDLGDASVSIHADTSSFDPELRRGVGDAVDDAEKRLKTAGKGWGAAAAGSMADELGKHGKTISGAVERGVNKETITIDSGALRFDEKSGRWRNAMGQFARKTGTDMAEEVAEAFSAATKSGGVFSKIGKGVSDAISAGFNVPGGSPLIAVLVPAIGAIGLAVIGAIQAVNGLGAALVAVLPLIAALGLQAVTVGLAFDGVGEAIKGAFAAKNAKELNEAIKGLAPAAQDFVKSLIPVRDMFNELKRIIQQNFFAGLGDSVAPMLKNLINLTKGPFAVLARQMGTFFSQLAEFFDSKVFATFVTKIFPATVGWLRSFGPTFVELLESLTRVATVATPFLSKLGEMLNRTFIMVANRINEAVEDGSLEAWLDRMLVTLEKVGAVFGSIVQFVFNFIAAVDQAGGNDALTAIAGFFTQLGTFLASPLGIKAIEGFINTMIFLTQVLGGLIIVFATLFAVVQVAAEAVVAFFTWIKDSAIPWIGEFFSAIGNWVSNTIMYIGMFFVALGTEFAKLITKIIDFFVRIRTGVMQKWNELVAWIGALPGRILEALGDLGRLLIDAGRQIIRGLWDGMVDMWNSARNWVAGIAGDIADLKGPLEKDKKLLIPAGEAIMNGLEEGMRGRLVNVLGLAADVTNTLADIHQMPGLGINVPPIDAMTLSATQNVNLNMGGVRFDGTPSETQARVAGRAVAGGMMSQVQQRDVAIAVRSM